MRRLDAEEILPLVWTGKPEDLAAASIYGGGYSRVAFANDGAPVAAWGANLTRPLWYSVWMFSTDRWPEVALTVTRSIKRELIPELIDAGAVRADCWSMHGHHVAHRWLECLGARREATLEDYGPSRKTYHCYSWTRTRLEREGEFSNVFRSLLPTENAKAAADSSLAPTATTPTGAGRSRRERRCRGEAQTAIGG
tara:strand:+ start:1069 stop:1656 length:588 start_codon:yes stop_codon:yes gene_type:complete